MRRQVFDERANLDFEELWWWWCGPYQGWEGFPTYSNCLLLLLLLALLLLLLLVLLFYSIFISSPFFFSINKSFPIQLFRF